MARAQKRKPIIYDSHEDYASMLHGSIPAAMQNFIRWWEGRLIRKVDCLITVGEKLRREFERRGARNTVVVANAKKVEEYRLMGAFVRMCAKLWGFRTAPWP